MSIAMMAVKILRRLPKTAKFDRHLDSCVALDLFTYLGEELPSLTVAHVFRRVPLPSLYPARPNPMVQRPEVQGESASNILAFRRKDDVDIVHV